MQGEKTTEIDGLRILARYDGPSSLRGGYFPADVVLHNTRSEPVTVSMEVEQSWGLMDSVQRTVDLDAGERLEFELLLRALHSRSNQYKFTFDALGEEAVLRGVGPSEYSHNHSQWVVLYASGRGVAPGFEESWVEEWNVHSHSAAHANAKKYYVTCRDFDRLSASWQAYTCVDTILLDLSDGDPSPEVLSAILAWCRSGGRLFVFGASLQDLRQSAEFQSIIDPRFQMPVVIESDPTMDHGLDVYHYGFGTVTLSEALTSEGQEAERMATIRSTVQASTLANFPLSWNRKGLTTQSGQTKAQRTLEAFQSLKLQALILLMIGFSLIMGPINFLWVKRLRRPMMLLITVPCIALIASISLLLYGVISQGLDIKAITKTWTLLDQSSGQGTTVEVRSVFAGSSAGEGMRPLSRTLVYPAARYWSARRGSYLFTQRLDDGLLLGGGYFPVREPMDQMIVSDRNVRLRLEVQVQAAGVVVENALGARVEDLLLRTVGGDYYSLGSPVNEGGIATLTSTGAFAVSNGWSDELSWFWGEGTQGLVPGSYIAILEESSFSDDCGIAVNEISGHHVLLGLFDSENGGQR